MTISALFEKTYGLTPHEIKKLPGAGSSRKYYRITLCDGTSIIGTEGDNLQENKAFVDICSAMKAKNMPVPEVLAVAHDYSCYLQEDLGGVSLFEAIGKGRSSGLFSESEIELLRSAIKMLAKIQILGGCEFDFSLCTPYQEMDARMVAWDLNYFKYCFLKPALGEVDDSLLQDEFDRLSRELLDGCGAWRYFMVRDFQSRNIMVTPDGLKLIDFQGGRRGPLAYDLVSLLWQAKANIPGNIRDELVTNYISAVHDLGVNLDVKKFRSEVETFALFRILQTLGAYGFRGLIQGKQHFIESIPNGVANLNAILQRMRVGYPYLYSLSLNLCNRFSQPVHWPGLTVTVGSFSYKKGYPADNSGNGGGFVFDCRAIHNPGRYDEYKQLTGRELSVKQFLEEDGEILTFLSHAEAMVRSSVERYEKRGFTSLNVWFGCTGGQHRSVYCADSMANFLLDNFKIRVHLIHREQGIDEIFEPC